MRGGIYHKVQVELTYNSNHIEGSRLSLDQTRLIFETATVRADGGTLQVDDIVETANHFRAVDHIIEHAGKPLSEALIKVIHRILKASTTNAALGWFAIGDYKRLPNEPASSSAASIFDWLSFLDNAWYTIWFAESSIERTAFLQSAIGLMR